MKNLINRHRSTLVLLVVFANLIVLANLAAGDPKDWQELVWLDIAGEGGAAMLSLLWIALILNSRPGGRVTRMLVAGLSGIFMAYWQDLMDEFIRLPESIMWDHWLESGAMPLGMVMLTIGIYHWHREQQAISAQLLRRERIFREHRSLDSLTPLAGAHYLREQLRLELGRAHQSVALIMLDLHCFDHSRRLLGPADSDRLLKELGELLLLNLRQQDLLCRYAGDRFAVVLPGSGQGEAERIASELQQLAHHFAFKTRRGESHFIRVQTGIAIAHDDDEASLIERANLNLARSLSSCQAA